MKNIALIPARGGSKGLPRKNVLTLAGKPLIAWSIEAARNSSVIDEVYVTTDDEEIASTALLYGAHVIQRPHSLATDEMGTEPVIKHALDYLDAKGESIKNVFLLQPTSPLRRAHHIDIAFDIYVEKKAMCLISVFEPRHSPAKAYLLTGEGDMVGLFNPSAPYSRRQDLPVTVQPNGAIYIFNRLDFIENNEIPRVGVFPYLMSESESIDIDVIDDLKLAEEIVEEW